MKKIELQIKEFVAENDLHSGKHLFKLSTEFTDTFYYDNRDLLSLEDHKLTEVEEEIIGELERTEYSPGARQAAFAKTIPYTPDNLQKRHNHFYKKFENYYFVYTYNNTVNDVVSVAKEFSNKMKQLVIGAEIKNNLDYAFATNLEYKERLSKPYPGYSLYMSPIQPQNSISARTFVELTRSLERYDGHTATKADNRYLIFFKNNHEPILEWVLQTLHPDSYVLHEESKSYRSKFRANMLIKDEHNINLINLCWLEEVELIVPFKEIAKILQIYGFSVNLL